MRVITDPANRLMKQVPIDLVVERDIKLVPLQRQRSVSSIQWAERTAKATRGGENKRTNARAGKDNEFQHGPSRCRAKAVECIDGNLGL